MLVGLGVDAVAEVDGYYWDYAVDRLGFVLRDGRKEGSVETHQDGSGFACSAFSQRASLVAFGGRPYKLTWFGSTRF